MTRAPHMMLAATLAVLGPAAVAQDLNDPTRPPPGLTADDGGAVEAGATPVLQSVMISPRARTAIISGQMVQLNGRYGAARVVRISETEVVLREGGQDQVLKLYPGVQKDRAEAGRAGGAAKR